MMGEFDLIKRYFTPAAYPSGVLLGVGDDAAVLDTPPGYRLVAAVDTIVEGVHFPKSSSAYDIGWRALAVNLSDMAAMGAMPRWFTLSLCLPEANDPWLKEFARGLFDLAQAHQVQLVGGDTVKGPVNISIQILGLVENDGWLCRSGAQPGDVLFVSGVPGEAAGGLQVMLQQLELMPAHDVLQKHFLRPEPRVVLGRALRTLASAAMDVSDGVLTDLHKLCVASGYGADLHLECLPVSAELQAVFGTTQAEQLALNGGDDYELLFTVPRERLSQTEAAMAGTGVKCTPIGVMTRDMGVRCLRHGVVVPQTVQGYDHFR